MEVPKARPLAVPWSVLLLSLAGCLECKQEVTIDRDGAGTQQVEVLLSETVLDMARRFAAASEPTQKARSPDELFREDLVRDEVSKAGLTLTGFQAVELAGRRRLTLAARFPGLAQLRASPLGGGRAEWYLLRTEKTGVARLVYYPQGKAAHEQANEKVRLLDERGVDETQLSYFTKQKEKLVGLDVQVAVTLPGDVASQSDNWQLEGKRLLRARITAADVATPRDLIRLLAPRYEAEFDASQCTFPLDRAEPETRSAAGFPGR